MVGIAEQMRNDYFRKMLQNEDLKEKLINDPTYSDQILSHLSRSAMTEKVAAKIPKGASFEKSMAGIDAEDPRRAMLAQMQQDMPNIIKSSPYGEDPSATIMKNVQDRGAASKEDIYKFIQSRQGFFGKEVAPETGYEEWEKKNPTWSSPITNAMIGAGGELASIPILGKAAQLAMASPKIAGGLRLLGGALSMAPPVGPQGILAKVIGAGLMGVTAFGAMDAVKIAAAKQGHELSIPEELLAGVPIFGGLNKLAKVGGRGIGKQLASMDRNIGGILDDAGKNANEFIRRPDGKLVPKGVVSREDIHAFSKELQNKEAKKAYDAVKEASFRKLEPEDHEAILRGADPTEILNNRIKLNKEKDIVETAAAKAKLNEEISEEAKMVRLGDSKIDHPSSIEIARRRLSPTAVETAEDLKFLRERINPEVVDAMNPRQAAEAKEAWIKHSVNTGTALVVREEFGKMIPQAVPRSELPKTVKIGAVRNPNVILGGMPERAAITADAGTAQMANVNKSLKEQNTRLFKEYDKWEAGVTAEKEGKDVSKAIVNLAGNKKTMLDLKTKVFASTQDSIISKGKEEIAKIADTVSEPEYYAKVQEVAKQMYNDLEDHILSSGYLDTDNKVVAARKGLKEAISSFTFKNTEALEKRAERDLTSLVDVLTPATSPKGFENLQKTKKFIRELISKGESGRPLTKEELAKHPDIISVYNKYKGALWGAAGAAALVPVSALFGGKEAEAASLPAEVLNRYVLPSALNTIKNSVKPVEKMAAAMIAAGHGSPLIAEDGQAIKQLMRGFSSAPQDVGVFPKTRINRMDGLLSPHTRGEVHFDARNVNGERLPHNAAIELADRSQVINANTEATLKVVKNILEENGIENRLSEIAAATEPLSSQYHKAINLEVPFYNARIKFIDDVLEGRYRSQANTKAADLSKQIKFVKKDFSKLDLEEQEMFKILTAEKETASKALIGLEPTIKSFTEDHNALMRDLASKHPTARVAMAVDGTGMSAEDPWLANMLNAKERNAVSKIKAVNDMYAVRMQETGHDIVAGPYMHHPAHPSADFQKDLEHLASISSDAGDAMRLVNFFHRSSNSKLMIPDTAYVMAKYVPDANKRIEISDFWKMGEKGGWDHVRRQMNARGGYDGAVKLLDDLRTAFDPMDTGKSGKWLNRYAALEVARLLTLSPSVSFKHVLKTMGNWAIFPAKESIEASGHTLGLVSNQIAQDLAGDSFKGKNLVADLGKAYTNQSHIYAAVSDMAPYELPLNSFDKFITKWNELGSAAVNGVERWDRGQTFNSAMLMASKKGMTPDQARYALMDSVLKVNFLTGPNNPKWLKDPLIRTMMMFQGTPFKILEQRAMLSYQAGVDIKKTGLELLRQLRADVKVGEERLKWNLIKDEFTKSKDIYGTPYTSQFLKQMMVIGTVIYTGKKVFDSEMWGHVVHLPGLQLGTRGAALGLNPVVGAAYKTATGGNITPENEDDFWMSRFLNSWLGNTGFPAIAHKMARLKDSDIPAIYKDSKLNYLFGVPKSKGE